MFLTGTPQRAPPGILHNLAHYRVLHTEVVFLTVQTEDVPRVVPGERLEIRRLGAGFTSVLARYGFVEDPHVPEVLRLCQAQGLDFAPEDVSYFLSRQRFLPARSGAMSLWRQRVFAFLVRNTLGATTYFHIPPRQVVELGSQVQF